MPIEPLGAFTKSAFSSGAAELLIVLGVGIPHLRIVQRGLDALGRHDLEDLRGEFLGHLERHGHQIRNVTANQTATVVDVLRQQRVKLVAELRHTLAQQRGMERHVDARYQHERRLAAVFGDATGGIGLQRLQTGDGSGHGVLLSGKVVVDDLQELAGSLRNGFDVFAHHFGMLFSEIFGGGEARLQLSDPDDVLNSDVEIYAAPPGKVIKSLSLLSGGEKSMVALTIYLAILLHRPTPFCMLDEVDAALDEANVQKYATYLKRFSHNTQLMVITHRRGTIELCDVLYGVYMQEKGVSGLLRQEFSEEFLNEVENA